MQLKYPLQQEKEGGNRTLYVPKGCPSLKHTMKSALDERWRNLWGWPHNFLSLQNNFRVLPKCFYLHLLPDAFMSEHLSYFLESKSGEYVTFEIPSVILSNLGSTSCLSEVPSHCSSRATVKLYFYPFFLHEISVFSETHIIIFPCL